MDASHAYRFLGNGSPARQKGQVSDEKGARKNFKKTYSSDSATPPCTADKAPENRRLSTDSSTYLLEVPGTLPSVAVSAATGPALTLSRLCRINIAGKEYVTTYECLDKHPDTLLGNPTEREKYFRPDMKAYYFNRSRPCFETILAFYQTGRSYQVPDYVCLDLFEEEKEFFRIPEPRPIEDGSLGSEEEAQITGGFLAYCPQGVRRKGWVVFQTIMDPTFSRTASIWHTLDIIFICISIVFMIMETDPVVGHYFVYPVPDEDEHEDLLMIGHLPINNILYGMESFLILFFTIDIITRFITWPGFLTFWKNIFNILDILSIVPFYISLMAHSMHTENGNGHHDDEVVKQKYLILKMCRIFRIVRVFKFVKHSKDLIVIVKVLLSSRKELGLLVILLGISTVTFGSIMFYVEHESNGVMFNSIMTGCWWALVTITTLGYGDIHPITIGGKIIGSVLLTFGMVFLTLPMTIIVSKFGSVYERENRKLYDQPGDSSDSVCVSKDSVSNINSFRSRTA
ncbi:hypothetical protein ACHWQZ_G004624 [Mnemiopsis leidyi]